MLINRLLYELVSLFNLQNDGIGFASPNIDGVVTGRLKLMDELMEQPGTEVENAEQSWSKWIYEQDPYMFTFYSSVVPIAQATSALVPSTTQPLPETSPQSTATTQPTTETSPQSTTATEPPTETLPQSTATTEPTTETSPQSTATTKPQTETSAWSAWSAATTQTTIETSPQSTTATKPPTKTSPQSATTTQTPPETGRCTGSNC